jgi:hypothetical protein
MRGHSCLLGLSILFAYDLQAPAGQTHTDAVSQDRMRAIYEEVKTPFKYGIVIEPPAGKKVDCPTVFRHRGKWYMVYVQLEPPPLEGYTTQLAESDNLLQWKPLGTILFRGEKGAWDQANAAGGVALFDPTWGGSNSLQTYEGRYWMSYIGGQGYGYEAVPLSIGLASTTDPSQPQPWSKVAAPILTTTDRDVRAGETGTLYKSYILKDEAKSLGARFVVFYNAKPLEGTEKIFAAVSDDLRQWRRIGATPAGSCSISGRSGSQAHLTRSPPQGPGYLDEVVGRGSDSAVRAVRHALRPQALADQTRRHRLSLLLRGRRHEAGAPRDCSRHFERSRARRSMRPQG